jgi:hypothetical protein
LPDQKAWTALSNPSDLLKIKIDLGEPFSTASRQNPRQSSALLSGKSLHLKKSLLVILILYIKKLPLYIKGNSLKKSY